MLLDAFVGGRGVHSNNNDDDVIARDNDCKDDNDDANTQQPPLGPDTFQAERGGGDFDDNDNVKDNKDEQ